MRRFEMILPSSVEECVKTLAAHGAGAKTVAGGTDLLPNMKRRHQTPSTLVSLARIGELKKIANGAGAALGAGLTLNEIVASTMVREKYAGLYQAAAQVAYLESYALIEYLARQRGERSLPSFLEALIQSRSLDRALRRVYRFDSAELESRFLAEIR